MAADMSTVRASELAPEALWRRIIGPPSTRAGRWSAWIVGAVIGLLAAVGGLVFIGAPDLGWGALVALALSGVAAVMTAIVAGGMALAAFARGERSIIVAGPFLFGAVCLLWVVGLFVAPMS
jgi:hypothetical protein